MWIVFAGLQLNDPDPLLWITYYGLTAAYTLGALLRKLPARVAVVWGLLMWAVAAIMLAGPGSPLTDASPSLVGWLENEVAREIGGLSMIGLWMLFLAIYVPPNVKRTE